MTSSICSRPGKLSCAFDPSPWDSLMSVNLVIWAWSEKYDAPAKRKKLKIKFDEIKDIWADKGDHPCMAGFDFAKFEAAVIEKLGPEEVDGPYVLERYPRSLCFNLPFSQAPKLIPVIGTIARKFGLNAAELRSSPSKNA